MLEHRSLIKSFSYAFEGVKFAVKNNRNMKIHIVVAAIVVFLGVFFKINAVEIGVLGLLILLVIASEMINTSIEEMANLISREHSREAKIAKDVAAGMVLIASGGAFIVGIIIFLPYLLSLIRY